MIISENLMSVKNVCYISSGNINICESKLAYNLQMSLFTSLLDDILENGINQN